MGEEHQFSQEDLDAAVAAAKAEGTNQTSALQAQLDEERRARLSQEYQAQIDTAIDEGRLTPAQAEGMVEFMLALPGDPDQPFEYSRGEGDAATTEKTTPMAWFNKFVGALGHQVDLSDSGAGGDLQPGAHDFAAPVGAAVDASQLETHNRALEYQAAHPGVDYLSAVKAVSQ